MTDQHKQLASLLDSTAIQREYGVSYETAKKLMRQLDEQRIPDPDRPGQFIKKVYVRRADLQKLLDDNLVRKF